MSVRTILWVPLVPVMFAPEVQASSVRSYNFVELAMKSDAVVIGTSMRRDEDRFEITIKEVVDGHLASDVVVALFRPAPRGKAPQEIRGPRLVFLSFEDEGFALTGSGVQAIWPQVDSAENVSRFYPYKSARDLDLLANVCRQLKAFRSLNDPDERVSLMLEFLANRDSFLRLVGMQLCSYLRSADPGLYALEVDAGTAHALEYVRDSDLFLYYAAVQVLDAAPPSAALPTLWELLDDPSVARVKQNNAFMEFVEIAGTPGKFDFQADTLQPDLRVRAEGLKAMRQWLERALPRLLRTDAPRITDALKSETLVRRKIGKSWLAAAARNDFDFNPEANAATRAVALHEIEAWFARSKEVVESENGK